jgi:ubiquitin carboxyl-terminal hydrolase 7
MQKLFTGQMKSYIKCVHVDYESSRMETFEGQSLMSAACENVDNKYRFVL